MFWVVTNEMATILIHWATGAHEIIVTSLVGISILGVLSLDSSTVSRSWIWKILIPLGLVWHRIRVWILSSRGSDSFIRIALGRSDLGSRFVGLGYTFTPVL